MGPPDRLRRQLTLIAVGFPLLALIASAGLGMPDGATREFGCWVLPNARVLVTPGDEACPLRSHDQIWRVEAADGTIHPVASGREVAQLVAAEVTGRVSVRRRGEERWAQIPVREVSRRERLTRIATAGVVAGALLAIPLFLLWGSRSRAAVPFVLLYSAAAFVSVVAIAGRESEWLTRAALLALAGVPAIVAHLSLTFPRERPVIREVPGLVRVPHLLSVPLVASGWFALDRDPLLWPTFMYLLLVLAGGAWMILMSSCAFAIRESTSALERARARVLCYGALALPVLPTLLWSRDGAGLTEGAATYLWVSAVAMPLPIGLAISRYNLFNLGWDLRHWIGRLLYLGVASVVVALVLEGSFAIAEVSHPLRDPAAMLLVSSVCVLVMEPLRGRMLGFLETKLAPKASRLRRLRKEYERELAELHEPDALARRLGETLDTALAPRSGCVFLASRGEWRPAYPFGPEPPIQTSLVAVALTALADRRVIHLALDPDAEVCGRDALRAARVELAAVVMGGGEALGLVLLAAGAHRTPYTDAELDFVTSAAAHTGIALRNACLTEELVEVERDAAIGRLGLSLAHDLGKELDWMDRLVRRLPQQLGDPYRLSRDIAMIQDFTEGLIGGIRKFVGDAMEPVRDAPGMVKFDDMVEHAVRRMGRIHGNDRITQSLDPMLRALRCHENVGRVLANLLDNGLHAVDPRDPIHLFATVESDSVRLEVRDDGCGMSEDVLKFAFEPGFSTRREVGGLGVGLSVSREIIEALGGSIAIVSQPGIGTRVTLRVPLCGG
ncbi:MAG: sensor histidine kinase [Myxococcota bacterium]